MTSALLIAYVYLINLFSKPDKGARFIATTFISIVCACILFLSDSKDFKNYFNFYETLTSTNLSFSWIEPGFLLLALLFKNFDFSFQVFIGVILTISLIAKLYFITKYSRQPEISFIFYVSFFLLLHESTQIRVSIAITFLMFSIYSMSNLRYLHSLMWIALATMFHYSSITFVGLILLKMILSKGIIQYRTLLIGSVFILVLIGAFGGIGMKFVNSITTVFPTLAFAEKLILYSGLADSVFNPLLNVKSLFVLFNCVLILYLLPRIEPTALEVMSIFSLIISLACFFVLSDFEVLAVRLGELFLFPIIFILPMYTKLLKQEGIAVMLLILCSAVFSLYYLISLGFLV